MRWKWIKLAALVVTFGLGLAAAKQAGFGPEDLSPEKLRRAISSFGWYSPLVYSLLFAQPFIPLPASVVSMAGGLSFGLVGGFFYTLISGIVRGCGQFFLARLLGRQAVSSLLKGRAVLWDRWVADKGFETVFWIRLVPNVPYDLQNFGLGCSGIAFQPFLWATCLGLAPGIFLWVWLGHTLSQSPGVWQLAAAILTLLLMGMLRLMGLWLRGSALREVQTPAVGDLPSKEG